VLQLELGDHVLFVRVHLTEQRELSLKLTDLGAVLAQRILKSLKLLSNRSQVVLHEIELSLKLIDATVALNDLGLELIALIIVLLLAALTGSHLSLKLADRAVELIEVLLSL
jgi:hypothetical protein